MNDISARELRNHTAGILRRAEAGERLRITVSRRPVAELAPIQRATWVAGATMEAVLATAPADPGLLDDLAPVRGQTITAP